MTSQTNHASASASPTTAVGPGSVPAHNAPSLPLSITVSFGEQELNSFLRNCVHSGASDITIQSGDHVWGEIRRKHTRLTDRRLEHNEVERAVRFMYGATGTSQIAGGEALDFEYEIAKNAGDFDSVMRFRCNATGCRVGAVSLGVSVTMRVIPGVPPAWETMQAPNDITENFFPQYGLVLVIGTTGSGKSTLLASGNRRRLENSERPVKILTYEDPIEFVYTGLAAELMPQPSQVQIERNLKTFDDAGRNAMRRKGDVIVMGESRDRESVTACFEMALSGHAVYSTLHADTPAETFARMVSFFPEDAQPAAANKLLGTLKLIVAQKLERRTDDKVAAVRSWLVIDREVSKRLSEQPFHHWGRLVEEILNERKTSFEWQALPLVQEGVLSFDSFRRLTNMTIREATHYLFHHDALHAVPQDAQDAHLPKPLAPAPQTVSEAVITQVSELLAVNTTEPTKEFA